MGYLSDLRKFVGHGPLLMVGATVFVFDEKDRLLLLKRADNECWGPPGGAVEPGEVVEDTAVRETFEETGLVLGELSLVGVFSGDDQFYRYPNGDEVHNVAIAYSVHVERAAVRISPEHTEWQFFPLDEIPSEISPPIVPILKKILAGHRPGLEILMRATTGDMMSHTSFATTTRGLNRDLPPMRLYEKAKRLGVWNPSAIDLTKDKNDWAGFTDEEKDLIWLLLALFVAGEEAVTLDLLPLIEVVAGEGRIEEEMYLTTFLFEEAKHTDFFRRFLDEVCNAPVDLAGYHTENYRRLFYEALPEALLGLKTDHGPAAQVRASVTYNMVVEGVLAETGYHAFHTMLERRDLMPGLRKGISLLKQDESRHIAYGVYLLSRLIAEHPHEWENLEAHMNSMLPLAIGVIGDAFARYQVVPFGLVEDDFVGYAMAQFTKRFERLEKARGQTLEEIQHVTRQVIDSEDA